MRTKCPHCGYEIVPGQRICMQCDKAISGSVSSDDAAPAPGQVALSRPGTPSDQRVVFAGIGLIVGTVIGFLTRPSAFLIGQLPLSTVLSRGGDLRGMDQLLVPTAQASFNQMVFFAVTGAVIGFFLPVMIRVLKGAPSDGAVPSGVETLNNEAILKMVTAGLGEDVVLEKMKQSRCVFALSTSDLAQLKQSGASDRIIAGMLQNHAHGERSL